MKNASLTDYLKALPISALPHHFVSWLVYHVSRIEWPPLKNRIIGLYTSLFDINMEEAEMTDPLAYKSLNAFFTRALKDGARPLAEGENTILCPVDGAVSQAQAIENGRIFQAKGRDYSLLELMGGHHELADPFVNGQFATLYLSPRDYHRIHMPLLGKLTDMVYVPGRLYSVAGHNARVVPNLFARNERLVCQFDTPAGPMAMVLVGAINVSAIDTVWSGRVTPPSLHKIVHTRYENGIEIRLDKGAEMGRFNMGSTVIMLFGENVRLDDTIRPEAKVKMGQALGQYSPK